MAALGSRRSSSTSVPESRSHVDGAEFHFSVFRDLMGYVLFLPRLNVQLPLEQHHGAEGTHPGLISVHRGQIVHARFLQKGADVPHRFQFRGRRGVVRGEISRAAEAETAEREKRGDRFFQIHDL